MHDYGSYYWQNEKVRLRLPEPKDYEYSYTNNLDSEAMKLVCEEIILPPTKKAIIGSDSDEPDLSAPAFSIENLQGEYVGHIHFNYINERHGTFSIGVVILKKHRGNGYGKAAMMILLDYAFNERRLNKFTGHCLDDNVVSSKIMLSLGCKQEGTIREEYFATESITTGSYSASLSQNTGTSVTKSIFYSQSEYCFMHRTLRR